MNEFDHIVSLLVEQQFPAFYKDEGQNFVAFMRAYYEWLEDTNNILYNSKKLLEYRDIDETLEEFIVFFKTKYLNNIQFETVSNKRLFIKNSLDFYKSKGSQRAVDLLFRLIYGEPAEIYYPGDDVFKSSSGEWVNPVYLEITHQSNNVDFVGKQILGTNSGATAFVERLVRRKINNKFFDIFYISNVIGKFSFGESISFIGADTNKLPVIIGSANEATVIVGSADFKVGESVYLYSANGTKGQAIVTKIQSTTGIVQFTLIDGGYGYSNEPQGQDGAAEIYISNNVLYLTNVNAYSNSSITSTYGIFDTVEQPLWQLQYNDLRDGPSGTSSQFKIGDVAMLYTGTNVSAKGTIVSVNISNTTAGSFIVVNGENPNSTAANSNFISNTVGYIQGNSTMFSVNTNIGAYHDVTASGRIIGSDITKFTVKGLLPPATFDFILNEQISQGNSTAIITNIAAGPSQTKILTVDVVDGVFEIGNNVIGDVTGSTANLVLYETNIGICNVENVFYSSNGNFIKSLTSNAYANVSSISGGFGANFTIGDILFPEQLSLNTDFLGDHNVATPPNSNTSYMSILLDGSNANVGYDVGTSQYGYGFPKFPAGGPNTSIYDCLNFIEAKIGVIGTLTNINPGKNYNRSPFVLVRSPFSSTFGKRDYVLTIKDQVRNYLIDEIVKQYIIVPNTYTIVSIDDISSLVVGERIKQGSNTAVVFSKEGNTTINVSRGTGTLVAGVASTDRISGNTTFTISSINLQNITNIAQGQFKQKIDNETIIVKRLSFTDFVAGGILNGDISGSYSTIVEANPNLKTLPIGMNANIAGKAFSTTGAVTDLKIVDSGFGYLDQENVSFKSKDGLKVGTARLSVKKQGKGIGYYRNSGGFLSDNKRLIDSNFYQDYSYQVFSRLPFEKYKTILKGVLHVAGTMPFGKVVITSNVQSISTPVPSSNVNSVKLNVGTYTQNISLISNTTNYIIQNDVSNNTIAIGSLLTPPYSEFVVNSSNSVIVGSIASQFSNTIYGTVLGSNSISNTVYVQNVCGSFTTGPIDVIHDFDMYQGHFYYTTRISNVVPSSGYYETGSLKVGENIIIDGVGVVAKIICANNTHIKYSPYIIPTNLDLSPISQNTQIRGYTTGVVATLLDAPIKMATVGEEVVSKILKIKTINNVGNVSVGDILYQNRRSSTDQILFTTTVSGQVISVYGDIIIVGNVFGNFNKNDKLYGPNFQCDVLDIKYQHVTGYIDNVEDHSSSGYIKYQVGNISNINLLGTETTGTPGSMLKVPYVFTSNTTNVEINSYWIPEFNVTTRTVSSVINTLDINLLYGNFVTDPNTIGYVTNTNINDIKLNIPPIISNTSILSISKEIS